MDEVINKINKLIEDYDRRINCRIKSGLESSPATEELKSQKYGVMQSLKIVENCKQK